MRDSRVAKLPSYTFEQCLDALSEAERRAIKGDPWTCRIHFVSVRQKLTHADIIGYHFHVMKQLNLSHPSVLLDFAIIPVLIAQIGPKSNPFSNRLRNHETLAPLSF